MRRFAALVGCLVSAGLPCPGTATGFYVPQQTAYGAGRANAGGVTMAREASTVFFNPAGMTRLERPEVLVGINIITPSDEFQDQGTTLTSPGTGGRPVPVSGGAGDDPGAPTPLGSLFYVRPLGSRWWMGIAVTAPFGLRLAYDSDWFGRHDALEAQLITLDVAPTLAYRISDTLSLGGGLDVQYARAKLLAAVPNTLSPDGFLAAADGRSRLTGDDLSLGFNLGLLWEVTPSTRLGVHYRSKMDHRLKGRSRIFGFQGELAGNNGVFATSPDLSLPDVLSAGVAHELNARTTLVAEAQWFRWSRFEALRIRFPDPLPEVVVPEGYRDTYAVSLGVEHLWRHNLTLRAGIQFDRTPTVDRYRNTSFPDGNRIWTAIGFSYRPSRQTELTMAFQHVFFEDPEIDITRTFFDDTGSVRVRGRADSHVDTLSLAYRHRF